MNILVVGDFVPQYRVRDAILQGDFNAMFDDVHSIISEADFSIVNLEAPIRAEGSSKIDKNGPNLYCPNETINSLKSIGFNVATLANNHLKDYGEKSVLKTIESLETNKIITIGAGNDIDSASKIKYFEKDNCRIGIINCCEHEYSIATESSPGANPLNPVSHYYSIQDAKKNADFVVVIVHGGIEGYNLPTPKMQENFRFFIDSGADVVINHHQHCYSGYEIYKEKPIFYGLGNFCFDWPKKSNNLWCTGYMVKLNFDEQLSFKLYPYEQCNKESIIRLLNNIEQSEFEQNINYLNNIISSPILLNTEYKKYLDKTYRSFKALFSPYSNKYLCALYTRNLLPGFMSKKKWLAIKNKIECESHYDRLIDMINRQIK